MMHYKALAILGRLPAIGRAELESLLGATHLEPVHDYACLSDLHPEDIPFDRLGGTVKLAQVLSTVASNEWRAVQSELEHQALALAQTLPEGTKVQLGLSAYGLRVGTRQLLAGGLEAKRLLRTHGYTARLIPNQEAALSSAQVLHNRLAGERGIELLAVRHGAHTIIARTAAVQDINAYAARDQNRPKRDARVGMLPPKLAQTIVNLAAGPLAPDEHIILLDPFCGTGVVLQEALLMGYGAYGTDLEPRMIDYSRHNLAWLAERTEIHSPQLEVGDATTHHWQPTPQLIASEIYLGRPLSEWPDNNTLHGIMNACTAITEKFLGNLHPQISAGTRLCLALPAWRTASGRLHHLPLLDHLGEMGYNRVSFEHARGEELVYYRPEQIVARELLVITRK